MDPLESPLRAQEVYVIGGSLSIDSATPLQISDASNSDGVVYSHGVYTFALATDNVLITFLTDVLIDSITVQNTTAVETIAIIKLGATQIASYILEGKRGGTFTPPFAPMRVSAGVVLQINLNGANSHIASLLYRPA